MKQGSKNEFPYTAARLVESETDLYIIYYVWSVQKKAKVRKRVALSGQTPAEKRKDAKLLITEINRRLKEGWHIDEDLPEPVEQLKPVIETKAFTFEDGYEYYKVTNLDFSLTQPKLKHSAIADTGVGSWLRVPPLFQMYKN